MTTAFDNPARQSAPERSGRGWLPRLAACAALLAVMTLVVLSWLPQSTMARTGAPGPFEHIAAYAGASFLSALAVDGSGRRWLGLAFVALAAVLEAGQIFIPGRTAQVVDAGASVSGAVLGLALACGPVASLLGRDPVARRRAGRMVPVSLILLGMAVTPVWIALLAWLAFRGLYSLVN